eukprot:gene30821-40122_t
MGRHLILAGRFLLAEEGKAGVSSGSAFKPSPGFSAPRRRCGILGDGTWRPSDGHDTPCCDPTGSAVEFCCSSCATASTASHSPSEEGNPVCLPPAVPVFLRPHPRRTSEPAVKVQWGWRPVNSGPPQQQPVAALGRGGGSQQVSINLFGSRSAESTRSLLVSNSQFDCLKNHFFECLSGQGVFPYHRRPLGANANSSNWLVMKDLLSAERGLSTRRSCRTVLRKQLSLSLWTQGRCTWIDELSMILIARIDDGARIWKTASHVRSAPSTAAGDQRLFQQQANRIAGPRSPWPPPALAGDGDGCHGIDQLLAPIYIGMEHHERAFNSSVILVSAPPRALILIPSHPLSLPLISSSSPFPSLHEVISPAAYSKANTELCMSPPTNLNAVFE